MITNVKGYQNRKISQIGDKNVKKKCWWDFWKIYDLYVESEIDFEFTLFE